MEYPARLRVIVSGHVQGVFFRQSAQSEARRLGLTGWVRNLNDGSVEIMAEGPRNALQALAQWAKTGPPAADVAAAHEEWRNFKGEFSSFRVR
jgi:acylphosphatase